MGLPEHVSNPAVYLSVPREQQSIGLDQQEIHLHPERNDRKIPQGIKMLVKNLDNLLLERIMVKAAAPQNKTKLREDITWIFLPWQCG